MTLRERIMALAGCQTSADLEDRTFELSRHPAVVFAEASTLFKDAMESEFGVAWPVRVRTRFREAGLIPSGTVEAEWAALATLIENLPKKGP